MDKTLPLELSAAIEKLYQTFSRYRLKNFSGCSCCVKKSGNDYLKINSLRDLNGAAFSHYTFKAMTTWGDENDFRYFLPRILELTALDLLDYNYEIIVGKLDYAKWLTWNEQEQLAIKNYFQELMKYAVEFCEQQAYLTSEYLCSIARVIDDAAPYLRSWLEPATKNRILTLRYFVVEEEYGSRNAFLADKSLQRKQIVNWLTAPQTIETLENLFFCNEKLGGSADLAEIINVITDLQKSS